MILSRRTVKRALTITVVILLLLQPFTVFALTSSEAKQNWYDAKNASRNAQQSYREARLAYAANKTDENNQKVIETGKDTLYAALDEAQTWLIYVQTELDENPEVPEDLKTTIKGDISTNLGKIDGLRAEDHK